MVTRKFAVGSAVAACAACCAPLVAPLLWPVLAGAGVVGVGAAGGGWFAGLSLDAIICGGLLLAGAAGAALWWRQRRKQRAALPPALLYGSSCDLETCKPDGRRGATGREQPQT